MEMKHVSQIVFMLLWVGIILKWDSWTELDLANLQKPQT